MVTATRLILTVHNCTVVTCKQIVAFVFAQRTALVCMSLYSSAAEWILPSLSVMSQLEVQHHWKSWIQIVLENWQSSKILGSAASVTGTERTSKNDTNKYEKDLRVQHNHTWETHQT